MALGLDVVIGELVRQLPRRHHGDAVAVDEGAGIDRQPVEDQRVVGGQHQVARRHPGPPERPGERPGADPDRLEPLAAGEGLVDPLPPDPAHPDLAPVGGADPVADDQRLDRALALGRGDPGSGSEAVERQRVHDVGRVGVNAGHRVPAAEDLVGGLRLDRLGRGEANRDLAIRVAADVDDPHGLVGNAVGIRVDLDAIAGMDRGAGRIGLAADGQRLGQHLGVEVADPLLVLGVVVEDPVDVRDPDIDVGAVVVAAGREHVPVAMRGRVEGLVGIVDLVAAVLPRRTAVEEVCIRPEERQWQE